MSDKACIHGYTHCSRCVSIGSTYLCTRCMTRDGHQDDCPGSGIDWVFVELPAAPHHTFIIAGIRNPEEPSPPKDPDPC